MNIDANGDKEPPNEGKRIKDGVFGARQSSFAVSQLTVLAANRVEKDGAIVGLQGPSTLLVQPPSQGSVVCWERFLNVESIRVLLVENDDSTRHVVAALLRNCHYEVVMAANGLQAWKVLEDLNNRIDIVLTEVVMPFLPGIPLLSKIMSHKTRKNVPVIMMSSHDSMGLVFKCLSKGAVDFLVKPIRKNELKNLWQHVWRRCHSSSGSGSGSESGTQTHKSVKSKSCEKSGNSRSGDGENDLDGLNVGDGSDDGSGTQSSWTKQAVEVDSSPAMSPADQVAECPDSTCAQVIRSHAENSVHDQKSDKDAEDRDLETFMPRNMEPKIKNQIESPVAVISSKLKSLSEFNCSSILNQGDMGQSNPTVDCQFSKNKGGSDEASNPFFDGRESDSTREVENKLDNNKGPNVELSLKRLRQVEDTGRSSQDDRYVLHRSEQSAFSRYNTLSNVFKAPNGITHSSSMIENNAEVLKQESTRTTQAQSSPNEISNMLDMGSTTNKHSIHPSVMKEKTGDTATINGLHHSAFRPVKNDLRYSHSVRGSQQEHQIHPPHQNHGCFHNFEKRPSSNQDESSLQKLTADGGHVDENAMNCGLDRSGSGSNHVSNGQNGSSIAINTAQANAESAVGQAGKSGSGGDASGCGDRVDEDKVARRLAALSKFRQKKKDRCFTKKVRYHNRKKLAEQRPRVRGQFVKQTGTDTSNRTSDE